MYLAILLLPFLGAAFAGLRGRAIGTTGAQIVTTGCITLTAVLAMVAFYEVGLSGSPVSVELSSWLDAEPLHVSWAFLFDDLTVSMLLAVLIVSALVHLYSASYMADDPHGQRFFAYLSFFTASMVVLVTGDSYLVIFLGWEGIGIASFLLIGFWLTRVQANKAAVKALTVNRVGDASLSVGLFALLWTCGSLEYASVYSVTPLLNETAITVIALLLFGGAMSKSAQVPLHTWLPDRSNVSAKNMGNVTTTGEKHSKIISTDKISSFKITIEQVHFIITFIAFLWILSLLVALINHGPLTLRRCGKTGNSSRGQIKLSASKFNESEVLWLVSILSPLINKPVYTTSEEIDTRDGSKKTRYTILLKTHPLLYCLWTVFYQQTPNGTERILTRENLEYVNPMVLCAFSFFGIYHYMIPGRENLITPSIFFLIFPFNLRKYI